MAKKLGEKISQAFSDAKGAAKKGYQEMQKGVKQRTVTTILKESFGFTDKYWEQLKFKIMLFISVFTVICILVGIVLFVSAAITTLMNFISLDCQINENDIGLIGTSPIIEPFYNSTLSYFYDNDGIIKTFRNGILFNKQFQLVKILSIIICIMFIGVGYIIGTIEMKTKDAIGLVIKLSAISFFTDPKSIYFYDNFIFKTITQTLDYVSSLLQSIVAKAALKSMSQSIPSDFANLLKISIETGKGYDVIQILDKVVGVVFSSAFFLKMTGAFVTSIAMLPIITITLIVMSYLTASVAKIVMYLLSMKILIAISLVLMPIFVCLLLFEKTKKLAQNYFEDGIIEPLFNYVFCSMFVSIMLFTAIGFLAGMLNYKVCGEWGGGLTYLISDFDITSIISAVILAFLCPICLLAFIFPVYRAVNFNMGMYIENLFYLAVTTILMSYNIESIQSIADKLSNAFNFNPQSRKKGDGSTPFGQGASKMADGFASSVERPSEKLFGKLEKNKEGKQTGLKGGALGYLRTATQGANFKVGNTNVGKWLDNKVNNLTNAIHGAQGFDKNLQKIASNFNSKFGGAMSNFLASTGGWTPGAGLISKMGQNASNYFSDTTNKNSAENIRKDFFGEKEHLKQIKNDISNFETKYKTDRNITTNLTNAQFADLKSTYIKEVQDSGITKETALRQFDFIRFDYKIDESGKESSAFEDALKKGFKHSTNYYDAIQKAKDEFLKSSGHQTNNQDINDYFDRRLRETKESIPYNNVIELNEGFSKIKDNNSLTNVSSKDLDNHLRLLQKEMDDANKKLDSNKKTDKHDKAINKMQENLIIKSKFDDYDPRSKLVESINKDIVSENRDSIRRKIIENDKKLRELEEIKTLSGDQLSKNQTEMKLMFDKGQISKSDLEFEKKLLESADIIAKTRQMFKESDDVKLSGQAGVEPPKTDIEKQAQEILDQSNAYKAKMDQLKQLEQKAKDYIASKNLNGA